MTTDWAKASTLPRPLGGGGVAVSAVAAVAPEGNGVAAGFDGALGVPDLKIRNHPRAKDCMGKTAGGYQTHEYAPGVISSLHNGLDSRA